MKYTRGFVCGVADCGIKTSSMHRFCRTHRRRIERGLPPNERISLQGSLHPNWEKNSRISYPKHAEMRRARKIKLEQAESKCEECDKELESKKLDLHHKDKSKDNHALDNLMMLCRKCHLGIYHKGNYKGARPRKAKRINGLTYKEISGIVGCERRTASKHILGTKLSLRFGKAINKLINKEA